MIAVLFAVAGVVIATRRGRHLVRTRVGPALRRSLAGVVLLARSPARLALLFGGSVGVTLAYIAALACAMASFDSGTSFAQIGAVYLGASLIAAAAPTPGGLGAIEAALVAGLTGVGVDPAIAVAGVLSYRLLTYWVPILPGWLSFRRLDRRGLHLIRPVIAGSIVTRLRISCCRTGSQTMSTSPGNSSRCSRRRSRARRTLPDSVAWTTSRCWRSARLMAHAPTRQRLVGSPFERQRDRERGAGEREAGVEGDRRGRRCDAWAPPATRAATPTR